MYRKLQTGLIAFDLLNCKNLGNRLRQDKRFKCAAFKPFKMLIYKHLNSNSFR